jgi:hypothetical protein
VQTRRPRCAQHGDGAVDIRVLIGVRVRLPGIMPSTGCAQEKVLACETVHNGRKLSTLGISRPTLHVRPAAAGQAARRGVPEEDVASPDGLRCSSGAERPSGLSWPSGPSRPSGPSGPSGPSRGRRGRRTEPGPAGTADRAGARGNGGPKGCAFAGRALAGLSSIRACVRRSGDSSAGSAGLSTSSPPARAAKMLRPEGRLPLRAGMARLGRAPRTGTAGTAPTSPGWPRSGNWSPPPIPNSRNGFPATYPQPNKPLLLAVEFRDHGS